MVEINIKEGSLVTSIKGHDAGRTYLVLQISNNLALCVDGKYKLIENPKKKSLKHLQNCCKTFDDLLQKYKNGKLYDFEVKTIIKKEVKLHKV